MPPWPTDGRGLYVPLAVFSSHAILSASPSFDDPNAADPFVTARCPGGNAQLQGRAGSHWFSCRSGVPVGERDLSAAMKADDDYAARTCRARRYLFGHMDAPARTVYGSLVRMCPET